MNAWVCVFGDMTTQQQWIKCKHFRIFPRATHIRGMQCYVCFGHSHSILSGSWMVGYISSLRLLYSRCLCAIALAHTHTYRGWNVKRAFLFISLFRCIMCTYRMYVRRVLWVFIFLLFVYIYCTPFKCECMEHKILSCDIHTAEFIVCVFICPRI